jgi:histidinol-phosphate aminotransferase
MRSLIRQSIRSMRGYVPGEQPRGHGLVKLNTNENPYPPSPRVAAAIAQFDARDLRLYPDPVCRKLRRRIAAMHGCRMENVFVANGSDEALALCTRAFVEDSGTIGFFNPSYSLYPVLAAIRNVKTAPVELGSDFEWRMPSGCRASLFFLTSPNAPTGMLYPGRTVRAFCRRAPGVVLIDEAYVDFARENCMDLALALPNVLVLRTFSKSFSLAGLRVGYIVGPDPLIDALYKIKDSYNVDVLAQRVALAALSDLAHMRRNAMRIRKTRERTRAALQALGFKVFASEANFLWVRPSAVTAESLFLKLRAMRILVRYFPGRRTGQCLRITIGTDAQMRAMLAAAAKIVRAK